MTEKASEEPVSVTFKVHSMVRKVATRTHRQKAAGRHRFVQRLAGGDITVRRARPATITLAKLEKHIEELYQAVVEGRIQVRTKTGRVVDLLEGFKAMGEAPASKPKLKPALDSAANDKTFPGGVGEHVPLFEGGDPANVNPDSPTKGRAFSSDEQPMESGNGDPAAARAQAEADAAAAATVVPPVAPPSTDLPPSGDISAPDAGEVGGDATVTEVTDQEGSGEPNQEVPGPDLSSDATPESPVDTTPEPEAKPTEPAKLTKAQRKAAKKAEKGSK